MAGEQGNGGIIEKQKLMTAVPASDTTARVDQQRQQAHGRAQQEDLRQRMRQGEAEIRAMNIHRPLDG